MRLCFAVPMPRRPLSAALLAFGIVCLGQSDASEKPAGKSEGGRGASATSPYYMLDAMPISIIREAAARGLLVIEIGIDAKTLAEREKVEHLLPRLRDLYIRALNLYAGRDLHIDEPVNPNVIKARLQTATDTILGPGQAVVLLRQILERKTN